MSAREPGFSPRRPSLRLGAPDSYHETVRLLASLSARHSDALRELTHPASMGPERAAAPKGELLGERLRRLEDVALDALGRLARVSDYEDALAAMQESGSVAWLWGAVLNRAIEATAASPLPNRR